MRLYLFIAITILFLLTNAISIAQEVNNKYVDKLKQFKNYNINLCIRLKSKNQNVIVPLSESRQHEYFQALLQAKTVEMQDYRREIERGNSHGVLIRISAKDQEEIKVLFYSNAFFWDNSNYVNYFYSIPLFKLLMEDMKTNSEYISLMLDNETFLFDYIYQDCKYVPADNKPFGTNGKEITANMVNAVKKLNSSEIVIYCLGAADNKYYDWIKLPLSQERQKKYMMAVMQAKPFKRLDERASLDICYDAVMYIKSNGRNVFCIGITPEFLFWQSITALKAAFYSQELVDLLIEDLHNYPQEVKRWQKESQRVELVGDFYILKEKKPENR